MVVDVRVGGGEADRALQVAHRALHVARAVARPAHGVGDGPVLRLSDGRLLQKRQRLGQMLAAVGPAEAQKVLHLRIVRPQLERAEQVDLGQGPTAGALLQGGAQVVEPRPPVAAAVGRQARDQPVGHGQGLVVAAVLAQELGVDHLHGGVLGRPARGVAGQGQGGGGVAARLQVDGEAAGGVRVLGLVGAQAHSLAIRQQGGVCEDETFLTRHGFLPAGQ